MPAGISAPLLEWNNESFFIVPNSLKYKSGKGERNVRAQSGGGSSVQMVVTENTETKKSMVNFELANTKFNIDKVSEFVDLFDANSIEFSDPKSGFAISLDNMTVINDPEIALSQDGNITVEMEGAPAS